MHTLPMRLRLKLMLYLCCAIAQCFLFYCGDPNIYKFSEVECCVQPKGKVGSY